MFMQLGVKQNEKQLWCKSHNEPKSLTFDEIIQGDKERTQWTERSDLWFKTVNP